MVTPQLFARYPTPADLAAADPAEVEELIRTTGFFRNKTKSIMGMAAALVERFGGEVPHRMEDLVTIPGVGRKTANVVRSVALGEPGLPVDTHVQRLSAPARAHRADRPGEDRARAQPDGAGRRAGRRSACGSSSTAGAVCKARKPRLRRLRAGRHLPVGVQGLTAPPAPARPTTPGVESGRRGVRRLARRRREHLVEGGHRVAADERVDVGERRRHAADQRCVARRGPCEG